MSARHSRAAAHLVALTLLAWSCGSKQEDGVAATLPCAVDDVFERNCRNCHASPPRFGAPMALGSAAEMHAGAKSDPDKPLYVRIGERIHDPLSPMPQGGRLSDDDLATLDAWISAGAPAGDGTACARDGGGPPAGEDALPCPEDERTTFLAHGPEAADAFALPADAGNRYMCFTWKAPWTEPTHATAFAPVIDDARVVHHWILYETESPQVEGGSGPCKMPFDAKFVQGWAPGGEPHTLPSDVGLRLPTSDRWLILQVHYWNVAGHTDVRDRSGVSMCTTTSLRPKTAVVSTVGTANIDLAPRSTGAVATGRCTPDLTEPVHVLSSSPHMHGRGRMLETRVLRQGSETDTEILVDVKSFDFESQRSYPSDLVVRPGDVLRTSCTYDNPSDVRVTFGEKTEDEMCFNFVVVWPAPGLVNAGGRASARCIDK